MKGAYYNENEPFMAQWLLNLMRAGHIAPGEVDCRDIAEVQWSEIKGYSQYHFFAGLGGWSLALRMAGWPDDFPVWTGSPPCQPYSMASAAWGLGLGKEDSRHLFPEMARIMVGGKPNVVFLEQVEAAIRQGWLDGVYDVLETQGYAWPEPVVLPAVCAQSLHKRDRVWVAAYARGKRKTRPGSSLPPSRIRQGWQGSPQDMRDIAKAPMREGKRYPQPIVRLGHDGLPANVVGSRTKGAGNAIHPGVAAQFIRMYMEMEQ